jgi:hypothetical protein
MSRSMMYFRMVFSSFYGLRGGGCASPPIADTQFSVLR